MIITETDIRAAVSQAVSKILCENAENELMAYHGSVSDFDEFDTNFIGTGESSQVYGWGLYMTAVKETGQYYAALIANAKNSNDKNNAWLKLSHTIGRILKKLFKEAAKNGWDYSEIRWRALNAFSCSRVPKQIIDTFYKIKDESGCRQFGAWIQEKAAEQYKKFLYTVELPNENFIEWNSTDKNFLSQILRAFSKEYDVSYVDLNAVQTFGDLYAAICGVKSLYKPNPAEIKIHPKAVSQFLSKLGYAGISVPIGNRHGGDGTGNNYVIFSSKDIKIINKEQV